MSDFRLNQACPKCHTNKLLYFDRNTIVCDDEQCDFRISYACPLCDSALEQETKTDDYGHYNRCTKCQNKIHWRRIKYLIETRLLVDQSTRCRICNGPTIHRASANMGHRCFFFPKCSGQTDLFNDSKETIVFLDFETTGLDSTRDHIIEIGALKIDEEGFEHVFEAFVKPPVPISEKITAITKITNEMVETAASIDHVLPQFLDFIHDSRLVAHNAEFDVPWLCVNAHRLNRATVIKDVLCTMKWAKQAKESGTSLGKLTKKYHITHQNAHRALSDAVSTKELYFIFEQQYADTKIVDPLTIYSDIATKQLDYYERTKKFNVVNQ